MFFALLLATFLVSLLSCFIVARTFRAPIGNILTRLVEDGLDVAWQRYMSFAIYVTGLSSGVRVWALERYIMPRSVGGEEIVLTSSRWALEIYRAVIETLQGIAWLLLVFFIFALISYVIKRALEARRKSE